MLVSVKTGPSLKNSNNRSEVKHLNTQLLNDIVDFLNISIPVFIPNSNPFFLPLAEFLCLRRGSGNRPPMLNMDIHFLPFKDPFLLYEGVGEKIL